MGHVIGEHVLETDMEMNPCKAKQLTNIRTKGSEEHINLTTPRMMTLEDAVTYIRDDVLKYYTNLSHKGLFRVYYMGLV